MNTQTSSLNCAPVSWRQEMVRSPQFNLFLFSKMTRRCNLKTYAYFGEVDNMQIICEWTHENILKKWGKSFSKQLEMPGSICRYQGPKQTSWRTYQVLRKSVIAFSLEKQRFTIVFWCWHSWQETYIHLYRPAWQLKSKWSIQYSWWPTISHWSLLLFFFKGGSQKY